MKTNKEVPAELGCIYPYTVLQKRFSTFSF